MDKATSRQWEYLREIKRFIDKHKFSPSYRNIAEQLEVNTTAAWQTCKVLEKKGYLSISKGKSRAITINPEVEI